MTRPEQRARGHQAPDHEVQPRRPGPSVALGEPSHPRSGTDAGVHSGDREALAFQDAILPRVSRTFALTIPQLPPRLAEVVSNAYLLCRIADTIEDDPELTPECKLGLSARFIEVVAGHADAAAFARDAVSQLASVTPAAEGELVLGAAAVVRLTHGYRPAEREALARCVRTMANGMAEFQLAASPRGLRDLEAMDRYCYHVAGVVGEMLTTLFCEHCPTMAARRETLSALAVSFGQGLQMTNILKDLWGDLERGACWLPRAEFARHGFDLDHLAALRHARAELTTGRGVHGRAGRGVVTRGGPRVQLGLDPAAGRAFQAGVQSLVGLAHGHLAAALEYTLMVPVEERGIRRFCLWALGMAMLTLRRVHARDGHGVPGEVKISRSGVRVTIAATNLALGQDRVLRTLFRLAGMGLRSPISTSAR